MDVRDSSREMPLCLNNADCSLTPISVKSDAEKTFSDTSSLSSHSVSGRNSMKVRATMSKKAKINSRGKDAPSTSPVPANQNPVAAAKKKKEKRWKFFCDTCEVGLNAGDIRSHHLGEKHTKKAVPRIIQKSSVTVMGFNPDTTSKEILYDYFSVVGNVKTVVICRGKESYAVIEFIYRCCVDHAASYLAVHRLNDSKLKIVKGLLFGKILSGSGTASSSQRPLENEMQQNEIVEEFCTQCEVLLYADNIRKHYLSREHTVNAYPNIKANRCINVTGFHPETSVTALYDYFSLPGRVVTIVVFREKKVSAVVEYQNRCSVVHAKKCLVPHIIRNAKLTVTFGLPFGGTLPQEIPSFLFENPVALEKDLIEKRPEGKVLTCICNSTFRAGKYRAHCLSQTHTDKAIPLMRDTSCVTITGYPIDFGVEKLYDYFNNFERIRTIDTRRQKQGLIVIEFESKHPLKNMVDGINRLAFGRATLTLIRGYHRLDVPTRSPVSHKKGKKEKSHQMKLKTVDCNVESQPVSSMHSIPDHVVQNELENAIKSLREREPSVKTVVEKHVDPVKNTSANNEKKEVPSKPIMCDACNSFYHPGAARDHHTSKRHNQNAIQYMNEKCCISVRGFHKDTRIGPLYDCFSPFGKVKVVAIHKKKEVVAIVEFYDEISARAARNFNLPHMLKSKELLVYRGQPKYNGGKSLESLPPHAEVLESLQKYKTIHHQMLCLQSSLLLSDKNMAARRDLWNSLRLILCQFFPNCALHFFGSSVNSFGLKGGDVDMLFEANVHKYDEVEQEVHCPKSEIKSPSIVDVIGGKISAAELESLPKLFQLDFIKKILRKHPQDFSVVVFIPSASCPIVKFLSRKHGLSCDLSNGNRMSLCNTGLLYFYGRLDERVLPLVTTLRYWAKKFNYISSHNFSSYAFTLMVIFFLQTRNPPVLPSVKTLRSLSDRKLMVGGYDCSFCSDMKKIERSKNSETLESLLVEFFTYYGAFEFSKFVLSPLTGCCEPIEKFNSDDDPSITKFKLSPVSIQDPFLTCRNVSSFVKEPTLTLMIDHLRKVSTDHKNHEQASTWGIPQLFEVFPKQVKDKMPKKANNVNSFTMVKIALSEKILDHVQRKYSINCTKCIDLLEIAVHEMCCSVINVLRDGLLFDVKIIVDKKNHCEWKEKVQTLRCSRGEQCENCLKTSSVDDGVQNEREAETFEVNDGSCSAGLGIPVVSDDVQSEKLVMKCLVTNDISGSSDLSSSVSDVQNEVKENCSGLDDSFYSADLSSSIISGVMQNDNLVENCPAINDSSCSADLNASGENCPGVDDSFCSADCSSSIISGDMLNDMLAENCSTINDCSCSADLNASAICGDMKTGSLAANCLVVNDSSSADLSSSVGSDFAPSERLGEKDSAVNDISLANLNSSILGGDVKNTRLAENCLRISDSSCSADLNTFIDEKNNSLPVNDSSSVDLNSLVVSDSAQNEKLAINCLSVNDHSCSAGLKSPVDCDDVHNERLEENCPEMNNSSCSSDSGSEESDDDDGHFSDKESTPKNVEAKMSDELLEAEERPSEKKSSKAFVNINDYEPFLCIQLTAEYQTWVCRNKCKKECNSAASKSILEFEKCISQRITKDQTLKLNNPTVFKCEFYEYHKGVQSVLFLKVTPPELKRCWVPLTSFLKLYLPKMVESAL